MRWVQGEFEVDTDRRRLDAETIWNYLTRSYWAEGVTRSIVEASFRESLNFGLYRGTEQIGFARVVTDRATFAWLCDVFVLDAYQGGGLGKLLLRSVMAHPDLQDLRRWMLATRDAHGLYSGAGFTTLSDPGRFMEIGRPSPSAGG